MHRRLVARDLRRFDPLSIYHLTAHGVGELPIARDDIDFQELVLRLGRIVRSRGWECYGVCLMDNHEHLVVRAPAGDLDRGMQTLHGGYARAYNKRHRRRGPVFEPHFFDRRIRSDDHLLSTIRYLALNPGATRAATYHWSTYPQLIGTREPWWWFDPLPVVELFGSVAALRDFVEGERPQTSLTP